MTDQTPRTYPQGVPSWIDARQPDPDAAQAFYGGLFGWDFEERLPPGVPGSYRIVSVDGREVGAIASSEDPATWTTYIAVDDADTVAARVVELGGSAAAPEDAGPGGAAGRSVDCVDPRGAAFGLWQARARLGAQHVNAPGGWVFSDLRSTEPEQAFSFYEQLFGWQVSDVQEGPSAMVRLPGYGDHLAATTDPGIHERQSGAKVPPGFADAIGWVVPVAPDAEPGWHVTFTVAERDAAADQVVRLGGSVVRTGDSDWTRTAVVRDPQGALFTVSQFLG